eukprot:GFKZ01002934.1.p1 GENE.GFKZ01002934.1~~GFKZ01002934.1.p1  ORF type:complete len:220 (-),score=6.83 GFKZ01002934.1:23-682(-)
MLTRHHCARNMDNYGDQVLDLFPSGVRQIHRLNSMRRIFKLNVFRAFRREFEFEAPLLAHGTELLPADLRIRSPVPPRTASSKTTAQDFAIASPFKSGSLFRAVQLAWGAVEVALRYKTRCIDRPFARRSLFLPIEPLPASNFASLPLAFDSLGAFFPATCSFIGSFILQIAHRLCIGPEAARGRIKHRPSCVLWPSIVMSVISRVPLLVTAMVYTASS